MGGKHIFNCTDKFITVTFLSIYMLYLNVLEGNTDDGTKCLHVNNALNPLGKKQYTQMT